MSDGWLDSTMQAINDRIKSPLWGYIILAWVWFNWPNLAMLFMSDAPVKFRIDYILSQEYFYVHYLLAPVFFGSVLAVITPYAQWLLSLAQKWATDKHSENIEIEKERLQDLIVASLEVMDDFFKVDNSRSLQQLKSRVEELLTVSDIEASTIRNALRQKKELTSSQTMKMFDMVEAKIKKEKEKGNNIESNELINQ